jgi:hypothetical protein
MEEENTQYKGQGKKIMILLNILIALFLIGFISADYSDCLTYGNCQPIKTIGTSGGNVTNIYNTYQINQTNNITNNVTNNYNVTNNITNNITNSVTNTLGVNQTQMDNSTIITIQQSWLDSLYARLLSNVTFGNITGNGYSPDSFLFNVQNTVHAMRLNQLSALTGVHISFTTPETGTGLTNGLDIGIEASDGKTAQIKQNENAPLEFYTNNVHQMEILANGNLNLTRNLTVNGNSICNASNCFSFADLNNSGSSNASWTEAYARGLLFSTNATAGNASFNESYIRGIAFSPNTTANATYALNITTINDRVTSVNSTLGSNITTINDRITSVNSSTNSSWTEAYARGLLFSTNASAGGNASWNESYAKGIAYSTNSTYNLTYAGLINNASYLDTHNTTYDSYNGTKALAGNCSSGVVQNSTINGVQCVPMSAGGDNASWNQSFATTLYSAITWNYNMTTATWTLYNSTWDNSWVNAFAYNHTAATLSLVNTIFNNSANWNALGGTTQLNLINGNAANISYLNSSKGVIGNCTGGNVIQNLTWNSIQCIPMSAGGNNASWNQSFSLGLLYSTNSTFNLTYDNYKTNVSMNWTLLAIPNVNAIFNNTATEQALQRNNNLSFGTGNLSVYNIFVVGNGSISGSLDVIGNITVNNLSANNIRATGNISMGYANLSLNQNTTTSVQVTCAAGKQVLYGGCSSINATSIVALRNSFATGATAMPNIWNCTYISITNITAYVTCGRLVG